MIQGGLEIGRLVLSVVGASSIIARHGNFSKLEPQTNGLAHGGQASSGQDVEQPPHKGVRKAGMNRCGYDMRDEQRACKVDAAFRTAYQGDEGNGSRAARGDEQGCAGDPAGKVAQRDVRIVENLVGDGGCCAGGIVKNDEQQQVRGVETGLQEHDLSENEHWIEAFAPVEGAVDGHGARKTGEKGEGSRRGGSSQGGARWVDATGWTARARGVAKTGGREALSLGAAAAGAPDALARKAEASVEHACNCLPFWLQSATIRLGRCTRGRMSACPAAYNQSQFSELHARTGARV
ncbi:hypothetical protein FGB62_13g245 [Gracilaria domingensis]|nr:hypothetical protein FGB62_13g245 [Gracilaria domingensis]